MWFCIPPQKQKQNQFETPDTSHQALSQFKDTFLFLSPETQKFHDNIEKATKLSVIVYNTRTLTEVWKSIIDSINQIVNHDLVCEHPAAAKFDAEVERKIQAIKEEFNKEVLFRKNCPITITFLLCKLMDNHQTSSPPNTSLSPTKK